VSTDQVVPLPATSRTPSLFVTVGTDHHPFDRLVTWADNWARGHPEAGVTVQFGYGTAPAIAQGLASLPSAAVRPWMAAADVVITQGGPGGIIDARAVGRLPIVVPRRHDLGEHVDNHQVAFATHLAETGRIALAGDEETFRLLIAIAIADPAAFRVEPEDSPTADTVAAIDAQIARITGMTRRRRRFGFRGFH
jgi:UDP-N-acetylglucosamine transferase subunit ALG13